MPDVPAFVSVAPVIPVRDLDAALERYRRLGFSVEQYQGGPRYGFVERGGVSLHLSESTDHDPKACGAVVYIYVADADSAHEEWSAAGVPGRLGHPHGMAWGLREFAYVDPDGNLHRVGSFLRPVPGDA